MKRLLGAFLIALGLHAALFFVKLADPQMVLPRPLEFKKIMVSLADIESPAPNDKHSPTEKPPAELPDQPTSKEKTIAQVEPAAPNPIQNTIKPLRPVQKKKPIEKQERKTPGPVVPFQKKEIIKTQEDFPEQNTFTPARSSVAGNVIQEAVPIQHYNHPPPYPRAARRRGIEGLVEVNVLVDINGRAKELHVHLSSGHRILDKAAIKSIRRWHFTPGRQNGKIMEMWVKVPVRFQLIADKIN